MLRAWQRGDVKLRGFARVSVGGHDMEDPRCRWRRRSRSGARSNSTGIRDTTATARQSWRRLAARSGPPSPQRCVERVPNMYTADRAPFRVPGIAGECPAQLISDTTTFSVHMKLSALPSKSALLFKSGSLTTSPHNSHCAPAERCRSILRRRSVCRS
jgi:hypothetical protein